MYRMHHIFIVALLPLLALLLSACAGMKFARNDGAHRYRALPLGTQVKVVGASLELPQPVVAIGTLTQTVTGGEKPDPGPVTERFRKHAARYGCDAVVGIKSTTRTSTVKKRKKKIGEGGKISYTNETSTQYHHDWTATCTRTSKAPGGLLEGTGKTAAMPPEALPVVPVPPRPIRVERAEGKGNPLAEKTWRQLAVFKGPFLSNWGEQFRGPAPAEIEVLECLNELLVQVAGPTGFWRRTVPLDWFGCNATPDTAQCKQAKAAGKALAPYERLQKSIGRTSEKSARSFLKRHARTIDRFLEDVVPLQASLSGMKTTTFYKKHFK